MYTRIINKSTLAAAFLIMAIGGKAQIKEAIVETADDGRSIMLWKYSGKATPVDIYWGVTPEHVDKNGTLLAKGVTGNNYVFYAPDSKTQAVHQPQTDKRVYYAIKPQTGKAVITATRRINHFDNISKLDNFKPVNNFRDVGGYLTKDGKRVKWGKFYRSNELSSLSPSEIDFVKGLKIGTIFDLRNDKEAKNAPDCNVNAEEVYFKKPTAETPEDPDSKNPEKRLLMWGKMAKSGSNAYDHMVNSNKKYATEYIPTYQKMFQTLTSQKPGEPILVHCAGGKDRTGAITAVFLSALDVPVETIINDYLLTGVYRQTEDDIELYYVKKLNNLSDAETELIAPAWRVYPEYIQAFLDTIKEKYGSMDEYLKNQCGLTTEMKAKLKSLYLEE